MESRWLGRNWRYFVLLETWISWSHLSPVGFGPSSKTWPRWAPHSAQETSVRIRLGSAIIRKRFPPTAKEQVYANVWWERLFNAQTSWSILPQPDFLLVNDVKEGRPSWAGVIFWGAGEMLDAANDAGVHSLLPVLVVLVAELPGNKSRLGRKWRCILCWTSYLFGSNNF